MILIHHLFHIFMEFLINYFFHFCLQPFPKNILHQKQMLLVPSGIFHSGVLVFGIRHNPGFDDAKVGME